MGIIFSLDRPIHWPYVEIDIRRSPPKFGDLKHLAVRQDIRLLPQVGTDAKTTFLSRS